MDTNINNYTIAELSIILNLDNLSDTDEITQKTNEYITKYTEEGNDDMTNFFQSMQNVLLEYSESSNDIEEQVTKWSQNQALKQTKNQVQTDKITERKQKIDVFDDEHLSMKRDHLGVNNTFNVDVAQDVLNPNLKNVTTRLINLDSQFRQASASDSSTDYTLDLSDTLNNSLSLRLYSFQIPFTWYAIDIAYGNTCFWIVDGSFNIAVSIEPGNYTPTLFVTTLLASLTAAGFTFPLGGAVPVSYNTVNAKITMTLVHGIYTNPTDPTQTFTINTTTTQIIFFDRTATLQCAETCVPQSLYINQTLGWVMGFRNDVLAINPTGNTGVAVLDLNGPRYLILAIDDYNQNHINNGLVGITELSSHLKMPSYYSPDLPYICNNPFGTELVQQLVPSAPRTLTQPQLYTINQIIKNNSNNLNIRAKAPTTTDVFAMIPIKQGTPMGSLYVDFSGSLQDNKRVYFGPVNIVRMRIRLLDDKGNILNLNGSEWSVTLISENLYQY